jgi:hypothetical protein
MQTLRLLKAYRSYRAGEVVRVPDGLAAHLREAGLAVPERQTELLPVMSERAVPAPPEKRRSQWP